ncbi:ADP-heptose:LPS heptosyltransferase-like protein [Nocardioides sp. CF8]|uniref:ADP-heptose--LPS heptosyltransferase n=1 Tax=Nocardioides sp. CF8 TaxID=110319 RepID=UPI00032FCD9D|nr:ADP-heptose--LPS heptosyltransferase [Nocardioides sp. CF8]EON24332.1 ADP-heptose:LPS heptosyltransferase-like protein [Nocardioides sp. CF8]
MDPEDLVAADPMMRTLRERHPDVNIVLLPPVGPIVDRPSATPAQCRALQQHADTVLATLSRDVGHEPSTRVDYWWSQSHPEVRRWVTAASYTDLGDGALPILRSLGNLLVRLGWEPRPAADGSPRLRGVAGPFELIASAVGDAVSINITSDPLHIPADLYDDLRVDA